MILLCCEALANLGVQERGPLATLASKKCIKKKNSLPSPFGDPRAHK
jgi:hypothetical protein